MYTYCIVVAEADDYEQLQFAQHWDEDATMEMDFILECYYKETPSRADLEKLYDVFANDEKHGLVGRDIAIFAPPPDVMQKLLDKRNEEARKRLH